MTSPASAPALPLAAGLSLTVNGRPADVLATNVAYFVSAAVAGPSDIVLESASPLGDVEISPIRKGIQPSVEGGRLAFRIEGPELLHLQLSGLPLPLFFFGNPGTPYDGKATYAFAGGGVHDAGEITLRSGESLYIEAGTIVRGSVRADEADGIRIYGEGILDGSYFAGVRDYRMILLYRCTNVEIRDIAMVHPPCWMMMLADCEDVRVDRVKQIGEVVSSDGIDIVGSRNVTVENCFLRNNDDCVVVKAFDWPDEQAGRTLLAARDVYGIRVRACTFVNGPSGNAFEIGHELTVAEVRDIVFEDIDIVTVHGYGAALSIHVGDRAAVRDVVFRDIRIQHYYDKLVDFRVMKSMYNQDAERGTIQDILLQDIQVRVSPYNPGYSTSLIGGYDAEHRVERITFDNFTLNRVRVLSADQLDLFTKQAADIVFR
ncbi:hypothetical protein HGI30_08130 [Paenibacillus albicereus]|uniref:Glycosyl hydrolases family 28 n=1 Tax=Paenibacillus albicereus TaxID=2726185 RepID=A0A6H2GVS8_9BACL|nr:glycosyl hydrolase family 28 protein [Paenibacillus albicereus]QJC51520.1 hypothetical protein HGI30_08130 [Paenibacillus albicereus]